MSKRHTAREPRVSWTRFRIPNTGDGPNEQFTGDYSIADGAVTVRCSFGEGSTQLGGLPEVHVAEILLRSILRNAGKL